MSFALMISALFVPMFLGMGELVGAFLYDNVLSGSLLQASAFVLLPLGLTNITSSLLNSLGLENKSFKNFVAGALGMILALWFLPPLIGINALVWGFGINYIITFVLNLRLLKKHTQIKTQITKLLAKYLLSIIPSGALTAFVVGICEHFLPPFLCLVIGSGVSMTSFILLACTLNLVDVKAVLVKAKEKIKLPKFKLKRNRT